MSFFFTNRNNSRFKVMVKKIVRVEKSMPSSSGQCLPPGNVVNVQLQYATRATLSLTLLTLFLVGGVALVIGQGGPQIPPTR
jgi:hypothetical protein